MRPGLIFRGSNFGSGNEYVTRLCQKRLHFPRNWSQLVVQPGYEPLPMNDPRPLPAIRTPFSVIWREFRIRVIPLIVFALIICAASYMWRTLPMGNSLRGLSEGLRSVVISPRVGVVQRLEVQPYQWVEAGDPLVTILPHDPNAQLNLLQSEL